MKLRRAWLAPVLGGIVLLGIGPAARGQALEGPTSLVERVEILQNQFLQTDTLLFYISTKVGDRYDEVRVKEDFRRLWETGFLDNLYVDVSDGQRGKIIKFVVQERKRIQIVDYRGSKAVTTSNIEDKLREKEAAIKIDTFYDLGKVRRVESIIKDMLLEKGRRFAEVKHELKPVGSSGLQLSFTIDDGPSTRVQKIKFVGNKVFSEGQLKGAMKKIKESGFFNLSWLSGKRTYTDEKWGEDQKTIQDYYLDRGYVTATVGEPKLSFTDGGSKKKPKKYITLEIPVTEGDQYRVGEVKFEGLTVFKEAGIRPLFKLKSGEVYDESKIRKGYDKLRDLYGATGYFQWTGLTRRSPDSERKVVDVVLAMDEDKRYYVGRIVFTGNDTTRDKVIRREVYMNEGDVFNTEALKLSIKRINQLGYFKAMEGAPNLQPSNLGEDKLDVTFKVEEQNRNQFTFGGGVSGLEGTFINASFSTANFLGLGETFQVSAQTGARTKNYQLAVTEPYFLDRPITAGFDVFKRKVIYQSYATVLGYTQEGTGMSLVFGRPVGRFSRAFCNYSFEVVNISDIGQTVATPTTVNPGTGQPVFNPFFFGSEGKRTESRISPSIVKNTVDSPYTPHAGRKFTVSGTVAGGPFGGDLDYFKPDLEAIAYFPHTRRTSFGMRAELGWLLPYGNTAHIDPRTGRNLLPFYQRYFLGGETQIRGYNVRSVGPIDPLNRALGGNKFALFNAEYYIDLFGPVRFLFFFDGGQAYLEDHSIDLSEFRTSTGVELRFIMPVINIPFRLIYAWNPNRDPFQPKSTFKFAVGSTF